jgi:uncharacterized protein YjdB
MYNWSIDSNGGVKLGEAKTGTTITSLTANVGKCISVLVYMDGNYTSYAMKAASGKINLQFASDQVLTPMSYTGYVTSSTSGSQESTGLTVSGDSSITVDGTTTLTAKYGGQDVSATWSSNRTDVATVDSNGSVKGIAEGTATITASYTPSDASEPLTKDFTITVTASE